MIAWAIAIICMLPPFALAVFQASTGRTGSRLAAVQLTTSLAGLLLIAMTFAQSEPAFIDLALAVALLSLPGTLLMALFFERWL
jgi:multisubunit Na+/H+ antiporter MnhF subunit